MSMTLEQEVAMVNRLWWIGRGPASPEQADDVDRLTVEFLRRELAQKEGESYAQSA